MMCSVANTVAASSRKGTKKPLNAAIYCNAFIY